MDFNKDNKSLIINGLFGEKFSNRIRELNDYELLIRPDAFSISKKTKKGFELEIIDFKNLGVFNRIRN